MLVNKREQFILTYFNHGSSYWLKVLSLKTGRVKGQFAWIQLKANWLLSLLAQSGDEGNEAGDRVSFRPLASEANTGDWEPWKACALSLTDGHHFHVNIPPSTGQKSGRAMQLPADPDWLNDGTILFWANKKKTLLVQGLGTGSPGQNECEGSNQGCLVDHIFYICAVQTAPLCPVGQESSKGPYEWHVVHKPKTLKWAL